MTVHDRAKRIKLLILDCDGVLTDGTVYYDEDGKVSKRFDIQDGLGIKLAQQNGLDFAVISGLAHDGVEKRVRSLGIEHYLGGFHHKLPWVDELREKLGLNWEELAYMGDDWVDAAPMGKVGLPMAVKNAQPEILDMAAWITTKPGGHGAVREAVAMILTARGVYKDMWREWCA